MNDYDEQEGEEELHEDEENKISFVQADEVNDQTIIQSNDEETKLQNDLAKELKNSLKIAVTDQSPDIGPTPYKVAIVGMSQLGSATAFLLICRQIVTDVIIIDQNPHRLAGRNRNKLFLNKINFS